jgi:hypothetical protein
MSLWVEGMCCTCSRGQPTRGGSQAWTLDGFHLLLIFNPTDGKGREFRRLQKYICDSKGHIVTFDLIYITKKRLE